MITLRRATRTGRSRSLAALLPALSLAACTCGEAPEGVVDACTAELTLPPSVSTDILFVVDNSGSMAEEQEKVVEQLGTFIRTLAQAEVENDFQVAVVTTSVSQHAAASCAGTGPSLSRFDEQEGRLQYGKAAVCSEPTSTEACTVNPESTRKILRYDEPDLPQQFGFLIRQGTRGGSGQEMGLEAMRLALSADLLGTPQDATPPGNEGLLRPGSRLLVVIVSDEDDCSDPSGTAVTLSPPRLGDGTACGPECATDAECGSEGIYCVPPRVNEPRLCTRNSCETPEGRALLEPVSAYVEFLEGLDDGTGTGRKRSVTLAVIGPVTNDEERVPARCSVGVTEAYGTGVRYREAVDLMGDDGYIDSICHPDYGTALQKIAELVAAPQTLDLPQDPPDGHLLIVNITRGDTSIECKMDDGFGFEEAVGSAPARITMEGRCRLQRGDQLALKLACAG